MELNDIKELYYITPISNIESIMKHGILSHNKAKKIKHESIANQDVQGLRANKKIPGTGRDLHDYVNLYFDAHNPMLCVKSKENDIICVLCIKKKILSFSDEIIITDQNAAKSCWFKTVAEGLPLLKKNEIYAKYWTNKRLKGIKCAEVLVPNMICPNLFFIYILLTKDRLIM